MLSEGWNRKTTEASLSKLEELDLVGIEKRGSFPRFEKAYYLTDRGEYVVDFVRHLEKELSSTFRMELEEFSELPKGCMPILVSMNRRGYEGISRLLEKLNMSPHQAYRCLDSMESHGILLRGECRRGKKRISSYCLSERGLYVAVAVDALDRALEGSSNLNR
jgi:DNA-binding PadR family transcriptional regulator